MPSITFAAFSVPILAEIRGEEARALNEREGKEDAVRRLERETQREKWRGLPLWQLIGRRRVVAAVDDEQSAGIIVMDAIVGHCLVNASGSSEGAKGLGV